MSSESRMPWFESRVFHCTTAGRLRGPLGAPVTVGRPGGDKSPYFRESEGGGEWECAPVISEPRSAL